MKKEFTEASDDLQLKLTSELEQVKAKAVEQDSQRLGVHTQLQEAK